MSETSQLPIDEAGFAGHLVVPDTTPAPGLVVIQEIFGVNDYIRSVCDRVAALGYVALAPDLFWRHGTGITFPHTEDGIGQGRDQVGRLDPAETISDLTAALAAVRNSEHSDGRAGVIGFCFGGTQAFLLAAVADPDVAVSYYGSGVGELLAECEDSVTCPLLFQYGSDDAFIPGEQIAVVRAWAESRDNVSFNEHPSGHAFDNNYNPMFSDPGAAAAAWAQTSAFLAEHLGVA